jgi:hypothetical protein
VRFNPPHLHIVLCPFHVGWQVKPFVVSLSNHGRLNRSSFDKLRTNGQACAGAKTALLIAPVCCSSILYLKIPESFHSSMKLLGKLLLSNRGNGSISNPEPDNNLLEIRFLYRQAKYPNCYAATQPLLLRRNPMIHRFVFLIILTLSIAGCGQNDSGPFGLLSSANASPIPSFLQVGKTYDTGLGMNGLKAKVLEIDKTSGWIKTTADGVERWVNLNQVVIITEVTP